MRFYKKPLVAGVAAAIATFAPMPVLSAERSAALEEIVVTARKRAENLQGSPYCN